MLGQIILAQEFASGTFSGLRLYCRMDVSVYRKDGKFHFFVNEVTHGMNTGLFTYADHDNVMEDVWTELSLVLEHTVKAGYLLSSGVGPTPLPPSSP